MRAQRNNRILLGALVFALTLTFSLLYHNRYITDTYSWNEFNSILMHRGQMPYRDFFVYIPPALLLKLELVWYMSGGKLLGVVVAGIVERALLITLIYYVLSKWFRPQYSFLASLLSFLIMLYNNFDTAGDYTWLSFTLGLLATVFLQSFFENREARPLRANIMVFIAFFIAAQAAMAKQSTGLAVACAMLLFMAIYVVCARFQNTGWTFAATASGLAIGLAPWFVWLYANDALKPFFEQVFFAALNSKGITSDGATGSTLINALSSIFAQKYWLVGLLAALMYFSRESNHEKLRKIGSVVFGVGLAAMVFRKILRVIRLIHPYDVNAFILEAAIAGAIIILVFAIIYIKIERSKTTDVSLAAVVSICFFLSWAAVSFLNEDPIERIVANNPIREIETILSHVCLVVLIALCFYYVISEWMKKADDATQWSKFAFVVYSLTVFVSVLISGGGLNYTGICYGTIPFVLCVLLQWCEAREVPLNKAKGVVFHPEKLLIAVCCLVICFMSASVMAMRLENAYSWWGIHVDTISDDDSYTVDYDMFDGFLVEKKTKTEFEQIGKLIEENSEKDDFIFIFPYSPIFKMMTDRYEAPTKVPVYFFDVCSDEMARSDLEIIKENDPKMIIWKDVGEDCWKTHEKSFRGGDRCGQRDIQDWFNSVKDSKYELIGQIENQYIYRLKDGTPINYTFFAQEADLVSNADEVVGNLTKSDYVRKLAESLSPYVPMESQTVYHVVIAVMVVLLMLCYVAGIPSWMFLSALFGMLYMALPCKAPLLSGFAIPFVMLLSESRRNDVTAWIWGGAIAGIFALSLTGWFRVWRQWGSCAAAVLVVLIMIASSVYALMKLIKDIRARERRWQSDLKRRSLAGICFVLLAITAVGIVSLYRTVSEKREQLDYEALQGVYKRVCDLRYDEEQYSRLIEASDCLPVLGSYGQTIVQIAEVLNDEEHININTNIKFKSKHLKDLSANNIYVRISGQDVFVWIQEDTTIGNSGWAIIGNQFSYIISNVNA